MFKRVIQSFLKIHQKNRSHHEGLEQPLGKIAQTSLEMSGALEQQSLDHSNLRVLPVNHAEDLAG